MEGKLRDLKTRLVEVDDLQAASALLNWDQTTYMPPGGAAARSRQIATLEGLAHEKFTDAKIGHLLDDLKSYGESLPYDSDDASLIRVTRRVYDQAVKVPPSFVAEMANHMGLAYDAWTRARPSNDFAGMRSLLEKTLDLSRQYSGYFPGYNHIGDPLIDASDEGMKTETVRAVFAELRDQLVPLVRTITEQTPIDDSVLKRFYPEADQLAFGLDVIRDYGFDFRRGRQDKTHHPFMTKFAIGDVRITTRVNERDLGDALFSTLHEAGHAMYEQGICADYEGLPLGYGTSSGVHESQSRLWENIVGRSRPFWEHYYPLLKPRFPKQFEDVSMETFYRAINKVQRSLIRTDADEVTYNLHVMLRFDLEIEMLEGKLAVRDLPEAWQDRYEHDLGLAAPSDSDGVLQDVHWYSGTIGGAFQGYTLGNIMSAQFYEAATTAQPEIASDISMGKFDTLHEWLRLNIYQHGRKFTADELLARATGKPLTVEPYMRYLRAKYGDLYAL